MRSTLVLAVALVVVGPAAACGPYCQCGCTRGGFCTCGWTPPNGGGGGGPTVRVELFTDRDRRPAYYVGPTVGEYRYQLPPDYAPPPAPLYAQPSSDQFARFRYSEGRGPLGVLRPGRSIELDTRSRGGFAAPAVGRSGST